MQLSVEAHNTVERVAGYAPIQWAFGHDLDYAGRLHDDDGAPDLARAVALSQSEFEEQLRLRLRARDIINKKVLEEQLQRARNTVGQAHVVFRPGQLVCVWRTGRPGGQKKRRGPGIDKGAW